MVRLLLFFKKIYFFVLFILLELLAFSYFYRSSAYTHAKVMNASNQLMGGVYNSLHQVKSYFLLSDENRQLLNRISELENQLEYYRMHEALLADTTRFESVDSTGYYIYRNARVVNNSIVRRHNFLTLNKGRLQGIEKDMAVTQNGNLVGYVLDVSDKFSVCMSLLNTDFKTSGRGFRKDYDGSLRWDGVRYDHATLSEIPRYAEISVGDTIVTTSFSSRFPEGIYIGTVESFELINGTYYEADIQLFTRFGSLRYVDVIRYKDMEERRMLEEMIENDI